MTTGLKILDELLLKQDPAVLKKINNNFIQQELLAGALASAGYGEYLVMKEQRDSLERKSLKACEGLPPCLAKELVNPGIAKLDTILDEMYESKFARHFFTEAQRAGYRKRWGG